MWEPTNDPDILPPLFKRRHGRPKKLRRRDPYEDTKQEHLNKGVARHMCSRCGQHGHNRRRCSLPPPVDEEPESSQAPNESQVINETQAQNEVPTDGGTSQAASQAGPSQAGSSEAGPSQPRPVVRRKCSRCKHVGHNSRRCNLPVIIEDPNTTQAASSQVVDVSILDRSTFKYNKS
ncbi:uncharacterized protein LOC130732149 [Lotus japonicus]|uniref:uncharacterized protein LOC130732149 n=1 Tax=Lotus japonicus TaxID=34305 RepID=UPI0025912ADE|nr:uncharacterized protein LOC130732149 [Lotus japonicus]